jgi:PKD repeat protein
VTDPGADTDSRYVIHWGDGSAPEEFAPGGPLSHTYANGAATRALEVDLVDEDGVHADAGRGTVLVRNLPPRVTASGDATVTAGMTYALSFAARDPGSDPFSIQIDWGDGSRGAVGAGATSASHTYAAAGSYTVSVTAADDENAASTATRAVQVITLQQTLQNVTTNVVAQLVAAGEISSAEATSLTASLSAAIARLDQGRTTAAAGTLTAFSNRVSALVRSGRIRPEVGQPLLDAAQSVLALIN